MNKPKRPQSSASSRAGTASGALAGEPIVPRSVSVLGHAAQPAATAGFDARKMNLDPRHKSTILKAGLKNKPFWNKNSTSGQDPASSQGKNSKAAVQISPVAETANSFGQSLETAKSSSSLSVLPADARNMSSIPVGPVGSNVEVPASKAKTLSHTIAAHTSGGIRATTMLFGAEKQITNNPLLDNFDGQSNVHIPNRQATAIVQDISSVSLAELCMLQQAFQRADRDGSGSLDPEEFIHAFMPFFQNPGDVSRLFMRIDADCDGVVSWEEFLSFVISQDDAKMSIETEYSRREFEYPSAPENAQGVGHREQAGGLVFLDDADRYISYDSKGELMIWRAEESDENARLHRPKDCKTGLPNISGVVHIHRFFNYDRLAVFSSEKQMTFVDVMRESCKQSGIVKMDMSPHCANSVLIRNDEGELIEPEALAFGDDRGCIHLFKALEMHKYAEINMRVPDEHSASEAHMRSWCAHEKSAFVHKIEYCNDLKLLISCGSDGQIVLSDVVKGAIKIDGMRHRSDVHDFVWLPKVQQLASCGIERHINVWQIGLKAPVEKLDGHKTSVQHLLLGGGQLFSLDASKILIIWDITEMTAVQKLDGTKVHPDFPIGGIDYDFKRNILVTVGKSIMTWRVADRKVPNGHVHPITCAVFNPIFEMVITADESSEVRIWDFNAGTVIFCFSNAHLNEKGETVKISAMSLDHSFRRLITGAHNGSAKIWNFSTGQCLAILDGFGEGEISSITMMNMKPYDYVVACGWNRKVTFWMDPHLHQTMKSSEQAGTFPPCFHFSGHKDDILSMTCHHDTNLLITGSFDGDIIVWKADCGSVRTRLVLPGILSMRGDQKPIEAIQVIDCGTRKHVGSNELEIILLIVTIGGDDCIRIWSSDSAAELLLEVRRIVDADDKSMEGAADIGLIGLSACERNKVMIVADTKGFVIVYDITSMIESSHRALAPHSEDLVPPERRCKFHAHVGPIRCLRYINTRHIILTSSQDCTICLWTVHGERMGTFGEQSDWIMMRQMHRYEGLLDVAVFEKNTRGKTMSEKKGFEKRADFRTLRRRQSIKGRLSALDVDLAASSKAEASTKSEVSTIANDEDMVSVFLTDDGAFLGSDIKGPDSLSPAAHPVNSAEQKRPADEVEERIHEEEEDGDSDILTDSDMSEGPMGAEEKEVTYHLRENIDEILLRGQQMKERGERFFEVGQPVVPAYQKIQLRDISEVQVPEQVAKRLVHLKASNKKASLAAYSGVRRRAESTAIPSRVPSVVIAD